MQVQIEEAIYLERKSCIQVSHRYVLSRRAVNRLVPLCGPTHYSTPITLLPHHEKGIFTAETIMTSKTHAAHTTCPGCQEEVYLDELVKGRCPLCGCTLEDIDEGVNDVEDLLDRGDFSWLIFNYFLFKQFTDLGASPYKVMQLVSLYEDAQLSESGIQVDTRFELELSPGRFDALIPRRCDRCHRIFIRGGRKILSGDLSVPGYRITYRCGSCK
ncbi:MAG: hypothetical protein A4E38_01602 [Methanoregulaceae archaeon PtaB.Bin108]|nr:MAG: hypothetical protein A4E38_01602 [Methanoregulaceae archaeon PtaB.Bin108]OPY42968.1 MAG: hypothetical protein A4E42_01485 [Methanoregulaceae archaeon PtaU1.Bin222]